MSRFAYLTTTLFCLGILQSLSSTPQTNITTFITLTEDSGNVTDERNQYTLSSSPGINESQFPASEPTTPEPIPPTPPDGYWNVTDGNITCIRAHLKIRFKIKSENETRYLVLPPDADSSRSSCKTSQMDQILLLHIDKEFDLAFTFERNLKDNYELKNITLTLFSPEGTNHFYNDIKLFSVQNHYSYWCKSLITVSMENVSMESFEMHIQAFGGSEKDFAMAEICDDDDRKGRIVTIVISCVLSTLFTSILIACFLQRRKIMQVGDSTKLIQKKPTDLISKQQVSSF